MFGSLAVKTFFRVVFDIDVTQKFDDIETDVVLKFIDKDDELIDVATPIVLQSIAVGLFMIWKKLGYTISNMPPDYFCKFFDELLREVFNTKLRELDNDANDECKGGEVISLARRKLESEDHGEE